MLLRTFVLRDLLAAGASFPDVGVASARFVDHLQSLIEHLPFDSDDDAQGGIAA